MAQSIESDEEPVDLQLNRLRVQKNFFFLLEWLFNRSRLNLNQSRSDRGSVEVQSRSGQGVVEFKRSPAKH